MFEQILMQLMKENEAMNYQKNQSLNAYNDKQIINKLIQNQQSRFNSIKPDGIEINNLPIFNDNI